MRGLYNTLLTIPAYVGAEKIWRVTLDESKVVWYDLLINSPEEVDTKQFIQDEIKDLEQDVRDHLDKRFIYFLATRKRVRFCTSTPPKYSFFNGDLILFIEIGADKKRQKISLSIVDPATKKRIKPKVVITEKYIRIYMEEDDSIMLSVHDFLNNFDLPIGESTEIHYVGYTSQPSVRPLNGVHKGLSRMLYQCADGDRDFFIVYNTFKVLVDAQSSPYGMNWIVANSMIDEVDSDSEGKILEKALISYFRTPLQDLNRASEEGELKNSLTRLLKQHKISSVKFQIELEHPNEYFRFYSREIPDTDCHCFACGLDEMGELLVEAISPESFSS